MTSTRPQTYRNAGRARFATWPWFALHVALYLVINAGLVVIWATTGQDAPFWPAFLLVFWGPGLILHARSVINRKPPAPPDVERVLRRIDHLAPHG